MIELFQSHSWVVPFVTGILFAALINTAVTFALTAWRSLQRHRRRLMQEQAALQTQLVARELGLEIPSDLAITASNADLRSLDARHKMVRLLAELNELQKTATDLARGEGSEPPTSATSTPRTTHA